MIPLIRHPFSSNDLSAKGVPETRSEVVFQALEPLTALKAAYETHFSFFEEDLFDVLLKRKNEGANPVGLDTAERFSSSERGPCRRSDLSTFFESREDRLATESGIYFPSVKLVRDAEGRQIDAPEELAVIAASASGESSDAVSRFRNQLRMAVEKGHEEIVVGDFPKTDPLLFAGLFNEPEFKGRFKRIDFAFSNGAEGKGAAFRELCNRLNLWNKKIVTPWTSDRFDLAVSAFAMASLFAPQLSYGQFLIKGMQGFAVANLADRCLRRYFLPPMDLPGNSVLPGSVSALVEEGVYNGLLNLQGAWGTIVRLPLSWVVGEAAGRSLLETEKKQDEKAGGFSAAAKIGALWAGFREIAFSWVPAPLSAPLLIGADSAVYALGEVCPKQNSVLRLPAFGREWTYKVLSAGIFRGVANFVGLQSGISAAVVQHILFNFSRALPEKAITK